MDTSPHPLSGTAEIPLGLVAPDPAQPRKAFPEADLAELAASLRQHGQLQAALVRWDAAAGRYVLLAGERRWRAAPLAGLAALRCEVLERELTPGDRLCQQLAENIHRRALTPVEAARGYRDLMALEKVGVREAARRLGLAPSTVSRALALLDGEGGVASRNTPPKRRGKARAPRGVTVTHRTPKRWVVTVATPRKGVTDGEVAAELEALAARLRAREGGPAAPRIAPETAPPADVDVA